MGAWVDALDTLTATSDFPEVLIEWLPTQGPYAEDGDWADLTPFVAELTTDRGRRDLLERFEAGTATLTLKATDRRFDAEYTLGPYSPWLCPMRQIRCGTIVAGILYWFFRGYIVDWGQAAPTADTMIETSVTARDAFAWFSQLTLLGSAFDLEVGRLDRPAPTHWWKLADTGAQTISFDTVAAPADAHLIGSPEVAPAPVVKHGNDGEGEHRKDRRRSQRRHGGLSPTTGQRARIAVNGLVTAYPFTIGALFRAQQDRTVNRVIFYAMASSNAAALISISIYGGTGSPATSGTIRVTLTNEAGTTRTVRTGAVVDDGLLHSLFVVFTDASTFTIYLDGGSDTTVVTANSPAFPTSLDTWVIGNTPGNTTTDGGFSAGYTGDDAISDVLLWSTLAIDTTRPFELDYSGRLGRAGELAYKRLGWLLDCMAWPTNLRDIDITGTTTLDATAWSEGAALLSVMQTIHDSELGRFFMTGAGLVAFRSRGASKLSTDFYDIVPDYGDAHTSNLVDYMSIDLPRDFAQVRNPVTAGRRGGGSITVKDQALIDHKYGPRAWTAPDTFEDSDSVLRDRAGWILAHFKEVTTRVASMTVDWRGQGSLPVFSEAVTYEPGTVLQITRTPLGDGAANVYRQNVEGIAHRITPGRVWRTEFRCSQNDRQAFWVLEDPNQSILDSTTRLAY